MTPSLLFLFLLLLYPLSILSSRNPALKSSIILNLNSNQDSTDDLIKSSHLASTASASTTFPRKTNIDAATSSVDLGFVRPDLFAPMRSDIYERRRFMTATLTTATTVPNEALVSFTGGKGNYRSMAREFLSSHNQVRSTVHENPFVWDRQLARFAKRWAEKQRSTCVMEHSMGPYGENMFWGSGWGWRATDAVNQWAQERDFYNPDENSCSSGQMCGHFTQIIWNSTVRIGCGRSECYDGGVIMTCNYDPPGNYVGENPLTAV